MNTQIELLKAIEFASWAHRNQKRKNGNPYIAHPFNCVTLIMSCGINLEETHGDRSHLHVLIAALLHDTLEDNPEEVTATMIEERFGPMVAQIVQEVTLDPMDPDKIKSRQKIAGCGWMTKMVKVADVLSNTMSTIESIRATGEVDEPKVRRRLEMERLFLKELEIQKDGDLPLLKLIIGAIAALDEMEAIAAI
jgi:(p)ppGpp synthase/HD superfamily hydrolase